MVILEKKDGKLTLSLIEDVNDDNNIELNLMKLVMDSFSWSPEMLSRPGISFAKDVLHEGTDLMSNGDRIVLLEDEEA